jgi:hypothetical protein
MKVPAQFQDSSTPRTGFRLTLNGRRCAERNLGEIAERLDLVYLPAAVFCHHLPRAVF